MIKISLVSTVFNEKQRLHQTIKNIEEQTLFPNEIIITDAGSTDGTYEILEKWKETSKIPVIILQEQKCNVAEGRNLAIEKANFDIIASTDFGCFHTPDWLHSIIKPFSDNPDIDVVGGAYGINEAELQSLPAKAEYILQNGYNIPQDDNFIVSSRSIAYKKKVWEELGGYPEWLTLAGDDSTFWKKIKAAGYKIYLSEKINVFWQRHESLEGFKKESFRYGLGDGESEINKKNTLSHIIETTLKYLIFPLAVLSVLFNSVLWWMALAFSLAGLRSYYHAFKNWLRLRSPKYNFRVLLYSFYMIEHLRWSYLSGFFKGYFKKSAIQQEASQKQKEKLGKYVG